MEPQSRLPSAWSMTGHGHQPRENGRSDHRTVDARQEKPKFPRALRLGTADSRAPSRATSSERRAGRRAAVGSGASTPGGCGTMPAGQGQCEHRWGHFAEEWGCRGRHGWVRGVGIEEGSSVDGRCGMSAAGAWPLQAGLGRRRQDLAHGTALRLRQVRRLGVRQGRPTWQGCSRWAGHTARRPRRGIRRSWVVWQSCLGGKRGLGPLSCSGHGTHAYRASISFCRSQRRTQEPIWCDGRRLPITRGRHTRSERGRTDGKHGRCGSTGVASGSVAASAVSTDGVPSKAMRAVERWSPRLSSRRLV